jgi:diaminopimelate epimerase
MKLRFTKMHGLGNDFVVLDDLAQPLPDDFDFARAAEFLCNRHFGIGGDGLLLSGKLDGRIAMRMWNPDGSEDMCGNGLRCIAALAKHRAYEGNSFEVATPVGLRRAEVHNGLVRVSMGEPQFELEAIPFSPPSDVLPRKGAFEYQLPVSDTVLSHVITLSTGSTHTVIFGPHPDEETFQKLSPLIENHAWFPQRTSIMWANVIAQNEIKIRIWERGAGETLACGTGACATAVAAQITGHAASPVKVHSKGGTLVIEWQSGQEIWKTGPAQIVFEGEVAVSF